MKHILFLLLAGIFLFSCSSNKKNTTEENNVITVSIIPQKTFVEKIAGNDFKINVLVPSGASPATYSLLPSQLKDVASSALWFRIGYIGFEYAWTSNIQEANRKMKVVDLSEGLDLIAEEKVQHGDHFHYGGVDPHTWMSPVLVKQMAKVILDEISALRPEKSAEYKMNYLNFVKELDQLDLDIRSKMKEYKGRKFVLFHPSITYFARDYGLEQISLETSGKEPTPKHLAYVVDLAKNEGIKVIYIQNEFDKDHARVFAQEINGEVVQIRPLDAAWEENIRELTNILIDNF